MHKYVCVEIFTHIKGVQIEKKEHFVDYGNICKGGSKGFVMVVRVNYLYQITVVV